MARAMERFSFECRIVLLLKIDYIHKNPPHDSDKNYSPIEGFV